MKRLLPLLVVITSYALRAQVTRSPLSSLYTGIGAWSKNFTDAFSGTVNQAALAETRVAAAGVYREQRFMLAALSNYAGAIAIPVASGGVGIAMHYFGAADFSTSQLGLGYGRKLGENADIGAQINYNSIRVPGYGSTGTVNFELGTLWHIQQKLHIGFHVYNPVGGRYGLDGSEKLASVYTMGAGYEASDKFFLSGEIAKEEDQPVNVLAGMQYVFAKQFFARAGMSGTGSNYFFGVGVKWKTCRVDIATTWHQQLGFTPALLLVFDMKDKKAGEKP